MAKAINSMSTLDMARDAVQTLQATAGSTPEQIEAAQAYVRRLEQERASGKIDPWTREGGIDDGTPKGRGSGGGVGSDQLTKKAASATIEALQKLPERFTPATPVQTSGHEHSWDYNVIPGDGFCRGCNKKKSSVESEQPPALTDGIYKDPQTGNIYKAQYNKAQGNGSYLYCKVMARVDEVVGRGGKLHNKITWTYAGSAAKTLQPEWKLSAQDATEFGKLYGICIYCGRELTLEESVDRAVGRICWNKHHG